MANHPTHPEVLSPGTGPPTSATAPAIVAAVINDDDSSYGGDDSQSETTSLTSTIYKGYTENGRKYSSLNEGEYWGPSDEKQFETFEAGHVVYWILDSGQPNQLFHSPIGDNPQHIIDIGTGYGTWAIEVADKYPSASVLGVDISPPPVTWVPSNCVFEVDDVRQEWTWRQKFDLIHMRLLLGAFTPPEWDELYRKCFEHTKPGGWFEHLDVDLFVHSDDGTLPADSILAGWGANFVDCAERAGRPMDQFSNMTEKITKAGFVEVHEKVYKVPLGSWPKERIFRDAGKVNREQWKMGMEGWVMWLLTHYGAPHPWSVEEVQAYLAKARNELMDPKLHIYHYLKRVWAKKPEV